MRIIGLAADDTKAVKKTVEDVMPIATGHEREEIQAELEVNLITSFFFNFLNFVVSEVVASVWVHWKWVEYQIVGCVNVFNLCPSF